MAGPMTVAADGTLLRGRQVINGRIVALPPGGGPERLTREVERDGTATIEPPSKGASAGDSYIDARDLVATDNGLLVLTFANEVSRIDDNRSSSWCSA